METRSVSEGVSLNPFPRLRSYASGFTAIESGAVQRAFLELRTCWCTSCLMPRAQVAFIANCKLQNSHCKLPPTGKQNRPRNAVPLRGDPDKVQQPLASLQFAIRILQFAFCNSHFAIRNGLNPAPATRTSTSPWSAPCVATKDRRKRRSSQPRGSLLNPSLTLRVSFSPKAAQPH